MSRKDNSTNKIRIVKFILKKIETSKPEIAAELGLSMPTVLQNVKELVQSGLVLEAGKYESTGGRKASVLSIVGNNKHSVGIDITANHISYVLIDLCGCIIAKKRLKSTFKNDPAYYESVADNLEKFLSENKSDRTKILGVGVSFPGIIDKQNETLVRSHVLKQDHLSLRSLSQLIPYPTAYENDANSALIAEMKYIDTDMIYLSLSNSVGGAVYTDGKIYEGNHRRSAEFGHMIIETNGKQCYCGKKGCADAYCSAEVLLRYANSLEDFFMKLESKDKTIQKVWDEYLDRLAVLITNLRMAFDCDIMLGGYVGGYLKQYMPQLSKKASAYNMFENDTLYIKNCTYEKEASAVGAAMHFIDSYFDTLN